MGAAPFITYSEGADARNAFWRAVNEAQDAHGRDGYSGTIAEKSSFTTVIAGSMTYDAAVAHARALLNDGDTPFTKWEPAGAIPVVPAGYESHPASARVTTSQVGVERDDSVIGWVFFGEAAE